ncbi:Cytochrome c551 peroxidase precursor [Crateriforma conspicua]|uniref:Cytochrome c551 peroxidase n=1 Tax=Crateriforma conspicua TaxID=2527996 RepID=A0A5C6FNE2_9PLAN|nr:cytochrome c peroxidase [Crateriforma conspicua]TWU61067.1 Cytochrome c551 peroxidase precursor [Crateriforma conspicua]
MSVKDFTLRCIHMTPLNRPRTLRVALMFAIAGSFLSGPSDATRPDMDDPAGRRLNLPDTPDNYSNPDWPDHFARSADRLDNTPDDNPITDHGATLGRVLFYDPTLSSSGNTSCASCHQQKLAFTDDERLSIGHRGKTVARNSMSLINVRFYQRGRFFWDERARTLEDQVLMPIIDPIEMGHQLPALTSQLQNDPIYPSLFEKAFGDREINQDRIAKALSQFVRSIVSYRAKYDIGRAAVDDISQPFPTFTPEENRGKQVFLGQGRCANCHFSNGVPTRLADGRRPVRQNAFFHMLRPVANGIDIDGPDVDQGVGGFNGVDLDMGRFKSPSLRNIEVTAPYMHDGRFETLYEVVEHYNWSVKPHPNLGGSLRVASTDGLAIRETDKDALIAFLKTLTDHALLSDPKYSDPFVDAR